ncbi:hypothetical protein [Alloscardovia criceti]|uniref:hypothetical protein n=1 Tax=Alloscardovia criceti TaxID=356828 RepID=UPI000475D9DA|nr:hypothetical protein [Alloscardovia criceti]
MYNFTPQRCSTTDKIMYATQDQAQEAARQSYVQRGVQLWVYVCQYCHRWHLTSTPPIRQALKNIGSSPRGRSSWGGKPIVSRKRGFKPRKH